MTFIPMDMNYEEIQEVQPVAEGEYTLVIDNVKEKMDDSGNLKGLLVILNIVGHDEAANVMHNLSFPLPSDDIDKAKNKGLFMKRFLTLFNVPFAGGIDLAQFPGKSAKAYLVLDEYNGTVSNKIKLPSIR